MYGKEDKPYQSAPIANWKSDMLNHCIITTIIVVVIIITNILIIIKIVLS